MSLGPETGDGEQRSVTASPWDEPSPQAPPNLDEQRDEDPDLEPEPVRHSTLGWKIACLLLTVAAVGAAAVSLANHNSADQWRTRADAAESLTLDLEAKLQTSEATVASLQERTVELANEKAKFGDKMMVQDTEAQMTDRVATELQQCADDIDTLFDAVSRSETVEELQALSSGEADRVFTQCGQAAQIATQLGEYLQDVDD